MSQLIYLAQPIDCASGQGGALDLQNKVERVVALTGTTVFRPGTAYWQVSPTGMPSSEISTINRFAIQRCSLLVAMLPADVPTLGTPVEIEYALGLDKPVWIFVNTDRQYRSVQVREWQARGASVSAVTEDVAETWGDDAPHIASNMRSLILNNIANRRADKLAEYQIKLTDPQAVMPGRGYPDDAGLDLTVIEPGWVSVGGSATLRTGVAGALPDANGPMWGLIIGRSSTWSKHNLLVIPSVIDSGWRGELFVTVTNLGRNAVPIKAGTRLAQIVPLPAWSGKLTQVEELPEHDRGTNGFGSTGETGN
jgi:dUTP pyrophosphatase